MTNTLMRPDIANAFVPPPPALPRRLPRADELAPHLSGLPAPVCARRRWRLGEAPSGRDGSEVVMRRLGKTASGRLLGGREYSELPAEAYADLAGVA